MIIHKTGRRRWENRHETFVDNIADMYEVANEPGLNALEAYNDCTKNFQQLIQQAVTTGVPLRILGAGWSWTKIASVENGIIIDTKPLNTSMTISQGSVRPGYTGDVKKLLFSQCGNGIWEISKELLPKKLSLKASGASNGQTIAGAMGTGAHGSAFDVGSVQDYVLGMHIITGPDTHIYLERASAPVVSQSFIDKLQTTLVQNDELFEAALVSMGAFGIIHGVLIEVEDLYLLDCTMRKMPLDDTLRTLMSTLDFNNSKLPNGSERPYHFAVNINPYDIKNGVFVYSFYKRPYRDNYQKPRPNTAGLGPGDDAPCFIGRLTQGIPATVPLLVTKLLAGVLKPYENVQGTLGEIFNNSSLRGKLMSAAIGIPVSEVGRVLDLLLDVNKHHGPFSGLFAFRFVKQTKALLGFTRFNPTCVFELDGTFSDRTMNFFDAVWKRLDSENIPYTVHWGKVSDVDIDHLKKMYGANLDKWMAARKKLLKPEVRKVFNNPIMHKWGLDLE